MKQYNQGFSLIELMVTLVIVVIIALIGTPSFNSAVRSSRLTAGINELVTSLNMARSEAIKRNRHVVVRKTGDNWEQGWEVFVDIDRSSTEKENVFDGDRTANTCGKDEDCLLKVQEALPKGYTLRPSGNNFTNFIRYTPLGFTSAGVGGSFYLCDTSVGDTPVNGSAKVLIINGIGRPRMALDANKNGIPEVTEGTDIATCNP